MARVTCPVSRDIYLLLSLSIIFFMFNNAPCQKIETVAEKKKRTSTEFEVYAYFGDQKEQKNIVPLTHLDIGNLVCSPSRRTNQKPAIFSYVKTTDVTHHLELLDLPRSALGAFGLQLSLNIIITLLVCLQSDTSLSLLWCICGT